MSTKISDFAHLRVAADARRRGEQNAHSPGRADAAAILAAGAEARGEKFDASRMVAGPDQSRDVATGDDLNRELKRLGRFAKKGEGC